MGVKVCLQAWKRLRSIGAWPECQPLFFWQTVIALGQSLVAIQEKLKGLQTERCHKDP